VRFGCRPLASLQPADVVQWQNISFPSWQWGFDSPHPLSTKVQLSARFGGVVAGSCRLAVTTA